MNKTTKKIRAAQMRVIAANTRLEVANGQHDRAMFNIDIAALAIEKVLERELTWMKVSDDPNKDLQEIKHYILEIRSMARENQND